MTDPPSGRNDAGDLEDEEFGLWEYRCQACDLFTRVDDMGLCEDCAGKLERDMVRKRDWDYSALAFGCPEDRREDLRREIIKRYGKHFELLADEEKQKRKPN